MKILNVGNRVINNYMIKLQSGYLLVDTGYHEQFIQFCNKLKKNNIKLQDISYIFLTHAHDDHAGFLNEILNSSDAKIILHKQAVIRLRKGQNCLDGKCTSYLAWICSEIIKLLGKGDHKFPIVDRNDRFIILDEKTQPIIEEELSAKIIYLPGHTVDSIGLLLKDGSLFCGDAAMNGFPSKNRIVIWLENLTDYANSWKLMLNYSPSILYPSHGKSFKKEDLEKNEKKINALRLYSLRNEKTS
jgi:Zn-dependent hydrolases, including glyoxylases